MKVVICEKPSQAQSVRAALGSSFGKILAAQGHILRLAAPHEVNPDWKAWGYDLLTPPVGETFFPAVPAEGKEALLETIREALRGASEVIVATDCDREGEMIGREIVDACGYQGTLKRAIYSALDETTIRTAFQALRPASDFDRLYDAARARATVDQALNLTYTRVMTVGFKPAHWKGVLGVGRVRTPLLALIVQRENEIVNFQPRKFYELRLDVQSAGSVVSLWWRAAQEGRIWEKEKAAAIASAAAQWRGELRVTQDRVKIAPPRLPHLTELQKRAGAWGWSPDHTLAIAQSLYDQHKITTYPRSECRHIPESQAEAAPAVLEALKGIPIFSGLTLTDPKIRTGKSGHYSTAEVEKCSHDAIVPNFNMAEKFSQIWKSLSDDEKKLFELISRMWLAAISPDAEEDRTTISIAGPVKVMAEEYHFKTTGRVEVCAGWRGIFRDEDGSADEDSDVLPMIPDGSTGVTQACEAVERTTTKPERFSIAELPEVMENIHRFVEDVELRDKLKDTKGIGTSATRGAIIEGLLKQGLLETIKKRVQPTEMGSEMIRLISAVAPSLTDAAETARMEMALMEVALGERPAQEVVATFLDQAKETVSNLREKADAGTDQLRVQRSPTEKMVLAAKKIAATKCLKLSKTISTDFEACQSFIREHGSGDGPTENMIGLARKIAASKGIDLPDEALKDFKACQEFLDKERPGRPPSEAMISAIQKIAARTGEDPKPEVFKDFDAASAYIKAHPMKDEPPTEAQINAAQKIAERKKIKIPKDAMKSKFALSKWISANIPS